jgi:hypothetical protein
MLIKYKDTSISISSGISICVLYHNEDPDPKYKKDNKFFFNYKTDKLLECNILNGLNFKAGMAFAPPRMKETMEDLRTKFKEFQDNGGGTIEDFLNLLTSYERNEKLKQLGI